MIQLARVGLVALVIGLVGADAAWAQGRRGGMVGGRGGGGNPGFRGSPSFSGAAARPTPRPAMNNPGRPPGGGAPNRPGPGINPGGGGRPNPGGIGGGNPGGLPNRPGIGPGGGRLNPGGIGGGMPGGGTPGGNRPGGGTPGGGMPGGGNRPPGGRPGQGGIGDRPSFGGIGDARPGGGDRPGGGRPPEPGLGGNRPGPGVRPGDRPGSGGGLVGQRPGGPSGRPGGDGIGNRPNIGNNVNRPINSGNTNVNRPINSGNTNINRPTNNVIGNNIGSNNVINRPTNITNLTNNSVTNVNRNAYGGRGGGYGYGGGGYGYGGYRPNPYAAYHAGWVNGYWNGNYARGWGWGGNNWGWNAFGLGMGIGVASWGLGSLWNSWGYSSFMNPYYMPATTVVQPSTVVVQPMVYDYSRPLDLSSPPPPQATIDQSVGNLDSARASFRAGDYPQALRLADEAIKQTPNDPMLHQFRAICLFAMGKYDEAAAPMYAVLSTGPGWDWTTLAGLYPDTDVYAGQLRALEAYCRSQPQAASARFLLAALYMTQGSNDAAAAMLEQVVALQPRDTLSAQLLSTLKATPPPGDQPAPAPAATAETAAPPSTTSSSGPAMPAGPVPANLAGSWTASPTKDVAITLSLDGQKGFTWKVNDRGQSRQFQGTATFDNDVLALSPPDQPPMVGSVNWKDGGHFQFKAIGAPPDDPGLTFAR